MEALGGIIWFLVTIVVPLAIGALIAYELIRRRRLRRDEREAGAAATRDMYRHETEEPAHPERLEDNPPPFR
jgi:flagellar biosynthesis/type III secretory pathway M-ring protein FliF/YscJ